MSADRCEPWRRCVIVFSVLAVSGAFAISGGLVLPRTASAGSTTTDPGTDVNIDVVITNKGISIGTYAPIESESGQPTYAAIYKLTRGLTAYFVVRNKTNARQAFVVMKHRTPVILPGGSNKFKLYLGKRGAFPYESRLVNGKKDFQGVLNVE